VYASSNNSVVAEERRRRRRSVLPLPRKTSGKERRLKTIGAIRFVAVQLSAAESATTNGKNSFLGQKRGERCRFYEHDLYARVQLFVRNVTRLLFAGKTDTYFGLSAEKREIIIVPFR